MLAMFDFMNAVVFLSCFIVIYWRKMQKIANFLYFDFPEASRFSTVKK